MAGTLVKTVSIDIGVKGDAEAKGKLDAIDARAEELKKTFPEFTAKIDTAAATEKLALFKGELRDVAKTYTATVKVDVDQSSLARLKTAIGGLFGRGGTGVGGVGGLGGLGGAAGGGGGTIMSGLPLVGGLSPGVVAGGAAAAAVAAPFIAQAAGGGLIAGLGAGLAGLAILGASKAKSVQDSFASLKTHATADLTAIGTSFVPVMQSIYSTATSVLGKLTPVFAGAAAAISKPFQAFADALIKAFGQPAVQTSIQAVATAFGDILKALTPQLAGDIKVFADGITSIATTISKNPKAFADFISFLIRAAGFAFQVIAALTGVATYIEQHLGPALHRVAVIFDGVRHEIAHIWDLIFENTIGVVIRIGHNIETIWNAAWAIIKAAFLRFIVYGILTPLGWIVDGAAKAFGWIPGIGGKLKDAAKAFDQFRDNVNNAINGINSKTINVNVGMQGVTQGIPNGIRAPGFASGAFVTRGTTGTADDMLARVSRGELIVPAHMVAGGAVDHLRGRIPGFAGGGFMSGRGDVQVATATPTASALDNRLLAAVTAMATKWASTVGSLAGVVSYAMQFLGRIPYVWGGTSLSAAGADCSGFTQSVYARFGIGAPRTSEAQYGWATKTGPVPGGLAFYISNAGGAPPGHVAIIKDASTVISQGGGMGPQLMGINDMPLMGTGVPPGTRMAGGGTGGNMPIMPNATGSLQQIAQSMLTQFGWGGQWGAFDALETREAGWNMNAVNPSSGAYGLAQFINGAGEYAQYGGTWLTGVGQLTGMMNYIAQRYGSPSGAWAHEVSAGWYDRGGYLPPGLSLAYNGTGRPERVGGGGDTYIINVTVPATVNPREAGRQVADLILAHTKAGGRLYPQGVNPR